jgi:4-hydroxybenzoate polyprenyltransferase
MAETARAALQLARPKQWTKGLLVFAALLFAGRSADPQAVAKAITAFLAINFASSAVYAVNDLRDQERDRRHPVKRFRPLASGRLSVPAAQGVAAICLLLGVGLAGALSAWIGDWTPLGLVLIYLAIQAAYNGGLKELAVADVFLLGSGFVLRAALGAAAIQVPISGWLLFCTGALSLMLGFAKRRHEFRLMGEDRGKSRRSLEQYTPGTLDAMLLTSAAGAAMSYGLYSIESNTARTHPALILTTVWVLYGIYRYLFLVLAREEGGDPENLIFRDPQLVFAIVMFLATSLAAMAGLPVPFLERELPR